MDVSNLDAYAVVIADRGGTIQFWSRGAEAMFGYSAQDTVGRRLDVIVPPDYRAQHWAGFNRAMESGTAPSEGTSFDLPVQHRSGEILACPGTFVLVRDGQKNTVGAMAILSAPAPSSGTASGS